MKSFQINAEVVLNEKITNEIFRLSLDAPNIAEVATPGQFLMVRSAPLNSAPLLRRPFSIHKATPEGLIHILFKRIGKGTAFLAGRKPGENLDLLGPLGTGFSLPTTKTEVCLVGGGMGVAPLYFLAEKLISAPERRGDILVLLGAANYRELEVIQKEFKALGCVVFIATDDGSAGHHGFVTDIFLKKTTRAKEWKVFTCGPQLMMKKIAAHCSAQNWGCQVSLETVMACGISACLGCAVPAAQQVIDKNKPFLHVCKEGPVFSAGDVAWI